MPGYTQELGEANWPYVVDKSASEGRALAYPGSMGEGQAGHHGPPAQSRTWATGGTSVWTPVEDSRRSARPWNWVHTSAFTIVAVAVLFARRPDTFERPQFWAEDWLWFQQAYSWGWRSLLVPIAGYLHTVPRVVGLVAQPFGLALGPLIFAIMAVAVQIAVPVFLLSGRCSNLIASYHGRLAASTLYLFLPNVREVHANLTNVQWHLALLACLVVVAEPPSRTGQRLSDMLILGACALTGPFAVLLLPSAIMMAFLDAGVERRRRVGVLGGGAAVQLLVLLASRMAHRAVAPLSATPKLLVKLIGGPFVCSSLIGERLYESLLEKRGISYLFACLALIAGVLYVYGSLRAHVAVRVYLMFALIVLAAVLASPRTDYGVPQWPLLRLSQGCRYWLMPSIGLFAAACHAIWRGKAVMKIVGLAVMLTLPIGIVADFRYPPNPDLKFPDRARAFEMAPPGTVMRIPILPPPWEMVIERR